MYSYCFVFILLSRIHLGYAQHSCSAYVIGDIQELRKAIAADSNKAFVSLENYIPAVLLDIKYTTKANAFEEQLYDQPYALRFPANDMPHPELIQSKKQKRTK